MSRPELQAPPEIYYGDTEAKKYTDNSRIQQIQVDMTHRALELLMLPPDEPSFLLDIGCGSGLSGEILDEEGYMWTGVDIAPSMLGMFYYNILFTGKGGFLIPIDLREVALEREVEGDLFLHDIGQGFGFRPGTFDGAISISVIQWLLNAESSHPTMSPPHRLMRFFTTLHAALKNPSRAVLQFYPSSDDQIALITSIAQKAGFGGGIVVDYPNSKKAKKIFLCLMVGGGGTQQSLPKGLDGEGIDVEGEGGVAYERRRARERRRKEGKRGAVKNKDWIIKKKELYRQRGKVDVPADSKYTGRKRKTYF